LENNNTFHLAHWNGKKAPCAGAFLLHGIVDLEILPQKRSFNPIKLKEMKNNLLFIARLKPFHWTSGKNILKIII
jgi:hypothetical protein